MFYGLYYLYRYYAHTRARLNFAGHRTGRDEISSPGDDFYGLFPLSVSCSIPRVSSHYFSHARPVRSTSVTHAHTTTSTWRNARENAHTRDRTYARVNTLARAHTQAHTIRACRLIIHRIQWATVITPLAHGTNAVPPTTTPDGPGVSSRRGSSFIIIIITII